MAKPFDLPIGQWWQVPRVGNSQLADVYASPNPGGTQSMIMGAWSSGCIDTKRKDLIVFGGGHSDYAGNEIYAFCFDPANANYLTWRRKNYYSTPGAGDTEAASGGGAASRHTYSGLQYSFARDKMIVGPGGVVWGPTGGFTRATWEFDCTVESPNSFTNGWTQKDDAPTFPTGGIYHNFVWSESQARGYINHNGFGSFNPAAAGGSQWSDDADFESNPLGDNGVSILVPRTNPLHLLCGDGNISTRRSLTPFTFIGSQNAFNATGDNVIEDQNGPGFTYDSNIDRALGWAGTLTGGSNNRDVYYLDVANREWLRRQGAGDTPGDPTGNGTFGRFRNLNDCGAAYSGLNILVNTTTSHVYFYRSSGAAPVTFTSTPLVAPNARRA